MKRFPIIFILILALFFLFYKNPCAKPYITFNFDDAYSDQFTNAFPIFQKHNIAGVVFVPTELVGSEFENHSLMNWQQLAQLKNAGWDIESHGVSHSSFTDMKISEVINELTESKRMLKEHCFDTKIIAIPYGNYSDDTKKIVSEYYTAARASEWGHNSLKCMDGGCARGSPLALDRYDLKSVWMFNDTSIETMKSWIDETAKNNYWTIIQVHLVREDLSWKYTISPDNLDELVAYIKSKNVEVKTISDVLDMHCDDHE